MNYHIIPVGDARAHEDRIYGDEARACWCHPEVEEYDYCTLIMHKPPAETDPDEPV